MKLLLLLALGVVTHSGLVLCLSTCNDLKTCGECIGHSLERCVWCAQDVMNSSLPDKLKMRCQPQTKIKNGGSSSDWCQPKDTHDPERKDVEVIDNKDFNGKSGEEIQLKPQRIKIVVRPGIPATFEMAYKLAKDYPLDMYFLMDNSFTMKQYATELATQTIKIYEKLTEMTNNVRLGIGSFVEKPALPYSDPSIKHSYAFEHHLSLTANTTAFKAIVNSYHKNVGSNYDSPESGLDALMQVMKCTKEIGWRDPSSFGVRRIIIMVTDATYHSAGDGKMIGAYKPNDMTCHLDKDNKYNLEMSKVLDYPSVSQINYVAKENNFKLVFAVKDEVLQVYKYLADAIFGAEHVELEGDKIISIIENAYIKAARTVKFQFKHVPASIKLKTVCDTNPNYCTVTKEKPIVYMNATITAMDCITDTHTDIQISPFGISDKLLIQLNIDCECKCEKEPPTISLECNSAGFKQCGICKCNRDRSGDFCETKCSKDALLENMNKCKEHANDVAYCNDHGECECGKCHCYNTDKASFSGKYCQFDEGACRSRCPADRGDCISGACVCKDSSEWTGAFCNCPVSDKHCIGSFSKKACSGHGTCECGKCECNSVNGVEYFGNYCESCKDCAKELCEQLKEYANCNYEKNAKEECDARFNETSVDVVTIMNRTVLEEESTATGCRKKLGDGNIIVYKYRLSTDNVTLNAKLELMIQDELETPPVANIWVTIGSVVGGILLVGLLTLIIWKVLTDMYDKREFEKFCEDASSKGYNLNPLYLDPTVTTINPAFNMDTCPAN